MALVWPFVSLAQQAGNTEVPNFVRRQLGLSESQFADPSTRVPIAVLARLLDVALHGSGERDLGLIAARRVQDVHLGVLEQVARTRGTLRSALEAGIRYLPLVGDCVNYSFELEGERAVVRFWFAPGLEIHDAAVEFVLAVGVLWSRRVTGVDDLSPMEVHFAHAKPADTTRHERLFGCPVRFGAACTQVVFATSALDRPVGRGAPEPFMADLLQKRAEGLLQSVPTTRGVSNRVRALLAEEHGLQNVGADRVAKRLGLGARTMARRLAEEHTSYRELVDDARRRAALHALTHGGRSIEELASELGFASSQSFQRAFRRWTGTTAGAYRKQAQA